MKNRFYLSASFCCFLTAFLVCMVWLQKKDEALASQIAPEVLRFHVLANSDSSEDQELKIKVKSRLLDYIYEKLGNTASKEATITYLETQTNELEQVAVAYMREQGFDYSARLEVTECYFPTKTYGDVVFPCGVYETAQVTLGEGNGRNWWCVLYPPLCFVDESYGVVPDESKDKLSALLPEKDYQDLMAGRRLNFKRPAPGTQVENDKLYPEQDKIEVHVKLKFLEMFQDK